MSFRELREFTEIMRALGYQRRISVENFRTPNFGLVADVLFWLVQRYDPLVNISDNIETEYDRVDFLVQIANALASKARIVLKAKNLYAADGKAVKELLKVARTLYRAMRINETTSSSKDDDDTESAFALSGNLSDLKGTRQVANEITDRGAKLYDLLGHESELRVARQKALRFLDAVASNLDSRSEHAHMERTVQDAIVAAKENVTALQRQVKSLKADETALEAKIKKKTQELERNEKRLKSIQAVRPAFMDEYEKLEKELVEEYEIYLERFRNLDFLEHELDACQRAEREKLEASDRALKKLQKKLRDEELAMFIGDQDVGDDESKMMAARQQPRPAAAAARRRDERPTGPTIHGSMTGGGSDTESSATDSDSGLSSDGPGAVSMNEESFSSDSSGGSLDIDDDEGASDLDSTGSGSDDFGGSESDLDDF